MVFFILFKPLQRKINNNIVGMSMPVVLLMFVVDASEMSIFMVKMLIQSVRKEMMEIMG